jgi:hypothetical protein
MAIEPKPIKHIFVDQSDQIVPKKYGDNYDENRSLINPKAPNRTVVDQADQIVAMNQVLKNYRNDFDLMKSAEIHYERVRSLNNTNLLKVDVEQSLGNIVKALQPSDLWNNPKQAIIRKALAEARSSILSRGVGPLEEIPIGDYLQDSVRAKVVISNTMIGPEQRLWAKLSQQIGNVHAAKDNVAPTGDSLRTLDADGNILTSIYPQNSVASATDSRRHKSMELGILNDLRTTHTNKNTYAIGGDVYSEAYAQRLNPTEETFNFNIRNLAMNPLLGTKSFPAHISSLNEATSSSWANISLINRSEDIYVYQRGERNFNLEFVIFASTDEEVIEPPNGQFRNTVTISSDNSTEEVGIMSKAMMWDRINFLQTLTRPSYTSNGKFDKAPYCELSIGGLFKSVTVIFESVNISYDPLMWDINLNTVGGISPMIALISTSGKFIHNTSPGVDYNFYKGLNTNE